MLDQNTDRMWYVIGAVIVGAALIFLMNGAFPTLFANVGNTFEDKVEQTTEMTDGIRPITKPGKNYLLDAMAPKSTTGAWIDYPIDMDTFNALKGETVTLSFDVMAADAPQIVDVYFRVHNDAVKEHLGDIYEMSKGFEATGEYQRYSHTMTIPDFDTVLDYPLSIRIRRNDASGSKYIHINDALDNGHVSINSLNTTYSTRHVKLELGTGDTEYIPHEDEME